MCLKKERRKKESVKNLDVLFVDLSQLVEIPGCKNQVKRFFVCSPPIFPGIEQSLGVTFGLPLVSEFTVVHLKQKKKIVCRQM